MRLRFRVPGKEIIRRCFAKRENDVGKGFWDEKSALEIGGEGGNLFPLFRQVPNDGLALLQNGFEARAYTPNEPRVHLGRGGRAGHAFNEHQVARANLCALALGGRLAWFRLEELGRFSNFRGEIMQFGNVGGTSCQ